MRSLRELQIAFARAILEGEASALPPERLQIYRNNVFLSLERALGGVYPALERLVGPQFFRQLARRFIREHPSRSGDLHEFGAELAAFLAHLPEAAEVPYLADIAKLEWSWQESFHAPGAGPLDRQRLAAVPHAELGRVRFILHPAARLVASRYPVLAIWEANREEASDVEMRLDAGADYLLIVRAELEVTVERLAAGDFALLDAFTAGLPLEAACEAAHLAQPQLDFGAAMERFVARRVITDFQLAQGKEMP